MCVTKYIIFKKTITSVFKLLFVSILKYLKYLFKFCYIL